MLTLHEFARRMPKAEIHVHLEGSIRPATLLKLAERNKFDLPVKDADGLHEFYRFRSFPHFIEVYVTITRCLQTIDDYQLIAYEFGADCARQNVRYAEVTFSILTNVAYAGLPWQDILRGLNEGRAQARNEFGVEWGWVFDIVRDMPGTQDEVVEIALAARDRGVVALGLGGNEVGFPAELFPRPFERARQAGLARVPHSGETAGPESIWSTLRLLHADRIGHGVRCVEDPSLMDYLREHQIPLEVCPTSNICLGVFQDYARHPLRQLWDQGLYITVNSDDPPLFNTDLEREYQILVDHFGFTADELERVSLNAVRASLLPPADKATLENEFRAQFAQLRSQPS
jgi:aminodeoxyfutalosine deaminase